MRDAMRDNAGAVREMPDTSDEIGTVKRALHKDQEPEWVVWLTVAGALIIGLIMMFLVTGQSVTAAAGDTNITYPSTWTVVTEPGAAFSAAEAATLYSFGPRLSVRQLDRTTLVPAPVTGDQPTAEGDLQTAAANWSLQQLEDLVGYRTLGVTQTSVQGKPAVRLESAYLLDPAFGGGGLPGLMRSEDIIVLNGETFDILSIAVEASQWNDSAGLRDRLLNGWKLP